MQCAQHKLLRFGDRHSCESFAGPKKLFHADLEVNEIEEEVRLKLVISGHE